MINAQLTMVPPTVCPASAPIVAWGPGLRLRGSRARLADRGISFRPFTYFACATIRLAQSTMTHCGSKLTELHRQDAICAGSMARGEKPAELASYYRPSSNW
jgi:hypothetical protein